jgi:hypothetical protein
MPLQSRTISAVLQDEGPDNSTTEPSQETQYVLDGQQRLTSIARVFLNANPKKNYYFDLKQMLDMFKGEETNWVITRQRSRDDPDRKEKGRLLRADIALNQQKTEVYVSEYVEDSEDFPEFTDNRKAAREAAAKIKGIFEVIRKYQVPVVVLDQDAPLESVCRVFETINSTGTRLTTFDLAVARFFPSPDLRQLWENSKTIYPILKDFEVDGERVLQVLALWYAKENTRFPEATRSALLSLDRDFITKNWNRAAKSLAESYEWAQRNGATPTAVSNHGILVSIAVFRIVCKEFVVRPLSNFESVLRRWYFSKIMQTTIAQGTNYRIGQDFVMLVRYAEENTALDFLPVYLTPERLLQINTPQDSRYKALQCIMATKANEDLITGRPLKVSDIEDHHIFPRSLGKEKEKRALLDSVANRIMISKETNRTLSNQHPKEYFAYLRNTVILEGTLHDANRRLSNCFIPGNIESDEFLDIFDNSSLRKFLSERAELILQRVREVLGESLHRDDSAVDDADD